MQAFHSHLPLKKKFMSQPLSKTTILCTLFLFTYCEADVFMALMLYSLHLLIPLCLYSDIEYKERGMDTILYYARYGFDH